MDVGSVAEVAHKLGATGYLTDGRSNAFHLPDVGSRNGGTYATIADFHAFWSTLFAGHIITPELLTELTRPHSNSFEKNHYDTGF